MSRHDLKRRPRRIALDIGVPATVVPDRVPVNSRLNKVDRLTGNDRSKLPLTPLQTETLDALTEEPAGPKAIAARCSLSSQQVASALWALAAKGLAVRTDQGWRRAG